MLCPEIKQRHSHANRAQSNFFRQKKQKNVFLKEVRTCVTRKIEKRRKTWLFCRLAIAEKVVKILIFG